MKISHHMYFSCNHLDTKTNEKGLNGLVCGAPDRVVTASSGHSKATSQRGNTWWSGAARTRFAAPPLVWKDPIRIPKAAPCTWSDAHVISRF
jgi:hypothetical protein